MALVSVFESFSTPVVLMFSIPLAAIGSLIALILTGNSLFNANTLTGFLILLGVVVNNGIILIDYSRILQHQGFNRSRALMMAGLARIRPILITAVTTIIAMLPLAMGKAEYVTSIGAPFAITVIGGLSLSTLLTLVYIPMLYNGLEESMRWLKSLHWRVKVIIAVLEAAGMFLVVYFIPTFIWQLAGGLLVLAGIPVSWWFISSSLRKASESIIDERDPILIRVSNLVKVYGRESKMVRDFKAGAKRSRIAALADRMLRPRIEALIWQIPLLGFLIYFTYISYFAALEWPVHL